MKVTLPQTAKDTLNEIISENQEKSTSIRIFFAGFDCSGPSFGLALDEQNSSDVTYSLDGLNFIMDQAEYAKYGDVTIEDTGYGFRVVVENMPEGGCGVDFDW
ncbi:MAG: Fe-S cluster assembly protein HesB [Clostridium sp.]|nr:Fe-S cluster assembly protein HesB [Clostridium sp.]